jgi:DNA-binding protein YbaB
LQDGPIVIAINGDLQLGRMLIEDSILELTRAKVFYDSAVAASMDALYAIVQQIQVLHSNGRKYYVNKLH